MTPASWMVSPTPGSVARRLTGTSHGRTMAHSRRARTQRGGLMLRRIQRIGCTLLALVFSLTTGTAFAQGTIKIMYTDPLSGPFAQVGDQNLQQFKYIIDYINGRGGPLGKKFELVSFDNKSQPSEALLALKS